jgi:hypothetical protein
MNGALESWIVTIPPQNRSHHFSTYDPTARMPQNPSFSELLSGEIVSLIALSRTFEEAPTAEAKTKLFKEHMAAFEVEFTENGFEKELEEMKAATKVVLTRDKENQENQENGMNITGSTKAIQHLKYYLDKGFGFLPTPSKGLLSGPHALCKFRERHFFGCGGLLTYISNVTPGSARARWQSNDCADTGLVPPLLPTAQRRIQSCK